MLPSSFVALLTFYLVINQLLIQGVPTLIVNLHFFPFNFISFCFKYFRALLFGAYTFSVPVFPWWNVPLWKFSLL